jgi:hypothetical protein
VAAAFAAVGDAAADSAVAGTAREVAADLAVDSVMAEREDLVEAGSEELEVRAAAESATAPVDPAEVGSAEVRPEVVDLVAAEREALAAAPLEEVEVLVADSATVPARRAEGSGETELVAPDSIAPGHQAALALAALDRDLPGATALRHPVVAS